MSIEIHQPELERRMLESVQSGGYHDVGELLTKALDALSTPSVGPYGSPRLVPVPSR